MNYIECESLRSYYDGMINDIISHNHNKEEQWDAINAFSATLIAQQKHLFWARLERNEIIQYGARSDTYVEDYENIESQK